MPDAGYRVKPRRPVVDIRQAPAAEFPRLCTSARALPCTRCYIDGAVPDTTKQNLLRMAAQRLGHEELARRMKIPESLLTAWMSGHASMPDRKLLILADLLDKLGDVPTT